MVSENQIAKKKHPLAVALCQVKFTPIMKMADSASEIQDHLRRIGLPRFKSNETKVLSVEFEPSGSIKKQAEKPQLGWEYANADLSQSILLNQRSISLVCLRRKYDNWSGFKETFLDVYAKFEELLNPIYVERIGLRYLDLVEDLDKKGVSYYFNKQILSDDFMADAGAKHVNHQSRTTVILPDKSVMTIIARLGNEKEPVLPHGMELFSLAPTFPLKAMNAFATLDFDNSFTLATPQDTFKKDDIAGHLEILHGNHKKAIESALTKESINEFCL